MLPEMRDIWKALSHIRETLTKPSDFRTDPVGWIGNQTGHWFVGARFMTIICLFWAAVYGEMPYRADAVFWWFIIYGVVWELILQKWRGWDTVEDTIFAVGYGGAGLLYSFKELPRHIAAQIEPDCFSVFGNDLCVPLIPVNFNWAVLFGLVVVSTVHLFIGSVIRQIRKRGQHV